MNMISDGGFGEVSVIEKANVTSQKEREAVSKQVVAWEEALKNNAKRAGAFGFLAVSLAACGSGGTEEEEENVWDLINHVLTTGLDDVDGNLDEDLSAIVADDVIHAPVGTFAQLDVIDGGDDIDGDILLLSVDSERVGTTIDSVSGIEALNIYAGGEDGSTVVLTKFDDALELVNILHATEDVTLEDLQNIVAVAIVDSTSNFTIDFDAQVVLGDDDTLVLYIEEVGSDGDFSAIAQVSEGTSRIDIDAGIENVDLTIGDEEGEASNVHLYAPGMTDLTVSGGVEGQGVILSLSGGANVENIDTTDFVGDIELLVVDGEGLETLSTGDGDDVVEVIGSVDGSVDLGGGNNGFSATGGLGALGSYTSTGSGGEVSFGGDVYGSIDLGDGNDTLNVEGDVYGRVDLGGGNNEMNAGDVINTTIDSGDGDDTVNVGEISGSTIDMGNGDNDLDAGGDILDTTITGGSDDDEVYAGGSIIDSDIDLGGGVNTVIAIDEGAINAPIFPAGLDSAGVFGTTITMGDGESSGNLFGVSAFAVDSASGNWSLGSGAGADLAVSAGANAGLFDADVSMVGGENEAYVGAYAISFASGSLSVDSGNADLTVSPDANAGIFDGAALSMTGDDGSLEVMALAGAFGGAWGEDSIGDADVLADVSANAGIFDGADIDMNNDEGSYVSVAALAYATVWSHEDGEGSSGSSVIELQAGIFDDAALTFSDAADELHVTAAAMVSGSLDQAPDAFALEAGIFGDAHIDMGEGDDTLVVQAGVGMLFGPAVSSGSISIEAGIFGDAQIDMGEGDNTVFVTGSGGGIGPFYVSGDADIGGNASVSFGSGGNELYVDGDIKDSATVTFNDQSVPEAPGAVSGYSNYVVVGDDIEDNASVSFGDGDNYLYVDGDIRDSASVGFGDGDNEVVVDEDIEDDSTVSFGDGDNDVYVGDDIDVDDGGSTVNISFGDGDNTLHVGDDIEGDDDGAINVSFGDGSNTLTVDGDIFVSGSAASVNISFGSGGSNGLILTGTDGEDSGEIEAELDDRDDGSDASIAISFGTGGDNLVSLTQDIDANLFDTASGSVSVDITFGDGDGNAIEMSHSDNSDITAMVSGSSSGSASVGIEFGDGDDNSVSLGTEASGAMEVSNSGGFADWFYNDIQTEISAFSDGYSADADVSIAFGDGDNNSISAMNTSAEGTSMTLSASSGSSIEFDSYVSGGVSAQAVYSGSTATVSMGFGDGDNNTIEVGNDLGVDVTLNAHSSGYVSADFYTSADLEATASGDGTTATVDIDFGMGDGNGLSVGSELFGNVMLSADSGGDSVSLNLTSYSELSAEAFDDDANASVMVTFSGGSDNSVAIESTIDVDISEYGSGSTGDYAWAGAGLEAVAESSSYEHTTATVDIDFGDGDSNEVVVVADTNGDGESVAEILADAIAFGSGSATADVSITFGSGGDNEVLVSAENTAIVGATAYGWYSGEEVDATVTIEFGDGSYNSLTVESTGSEIARPEMGADLFADANEEGADASVTVSFGDGGNNELAIGNNLYAIEFEGADSATVDVSFGDGNGSVMTVGGGVYTEGSGASVTIAFGSGNSTLDIGDGVYGNDGNVNITFSGGDNDMTVGGTLSAAEVSFGSGSDTLSINEDNRETTYVIGDNPVLDANINMGAGDDEVSVFVATPNWSGAAAIEASTLEGGEGSDALTITSDYGWIYATSGGSEIGGFETLNLVNDDMSPDNGYVWYSPAGGMGGDVAFNAQFDDISGVETLNLTTLEGASGDASVQDTAFLLWNVDGDLAAGDSSGGGIFINGISEDAGATVVITLDEPVAPLSIGSHVSGGDLLTLNVSGIGDLDVFVSGMGFDDVTLNIDDDNDHDIGFMSLNPYAFMDGTLDLNGGVSGADIMVSGMVNFAHIEAGDSDANLSIFLTNTAPSGGNDDMDITVVTGSGDDFLDFGVYTLTDQNSIDMGTGRDTLAIENDGIDASGYLAGHDPMLPPMLNADEMFQFVENVEVLNIDHEGHEESGALFLLYDHAFEAGIDEVNLADNSWIDMTIGQEFLRGIEINAGSGVGLDLEIGTIVSGGSTVDINAGHDFDGDIFVDEFSTASVDVEAGNSGTVDIYAINDGDITVDMGYSGSLGVYVSGNGDVDIDMGSEADAEVDVYGDGDVTVDLLNDSNAVVYVSGGGDVTVEVSHRGIIDLDVHGSGDVTVNTMSSSDFSIFVSGDGDIDIGDGTNNNSVSGNLTVFGDGNVSGSFDHSSDVVFNINGGGNVTLDMAEDSSGDVSVNGDGDVNVTMGDSAWADIDLNGGDFSGSFGLNSDVTVSTDGSGNADIEIGQGTSLSFNDSEGSASGDVVTIEVTGSNSGGLTEITVTGMEAEQDATLLVNAGNGSGSMTIASGASGMNDIDLSVTGAGFDTITVNNITVVSSGAIVFSSGAIEEEAFDHLTMIAQDSWASEDQEGIDTVVTINNIIPDGALIDFSAETSADLQIDVTGSHESGATFNVYGGSGDDVITIAGPSETELSSGGFYDSMLDGSDGADVLTGSVDVDVLFGGAGEDNMSAGSGGDILQGDLAQHEFQTYEIDFGSSTTYDVGDEITVNVGGDVTTLVVSGSTMTGDDVASYFATGNIWSTHDETSSGSTLTLTADDAGVDYEVLVNVNNDNDVATSAQTQTLTISGMAGSTDNIDLVVGGQSYTIYIDDGVGSSADDAYTIIDTGLAAAMGYDSVTLRPGEVSGGDGIVQLTFTGPADGSSMNLITAVQNVTTGDVNLATSAATGVPSDQETPTVDLVQDWYSVDADSDILAGGEGSDMFLVLESGFLPSGDSNIDTITDFTVGSGGDVILFGGALIDTDGDGATADDVAEILDAAVMPIEIDTIVNSGEIAALNSNGTTLEQAVGELFESNGVFEADANGSNIGGAGLFSWWDGGTAGEGTEHVYIIATGETAEDAFGSDDFIVELTNFSLGEGEYLSMDNLTYTPSV